MNPCSPPAIWQYYVAMSEELAEAVRQALERVPGSDRALAQEAGVPPSTISRIRNGKRGATADVVEALADALARWEDRCGDAQDSLRRALQREEMDDE